MENHETVDLPSKKMSLSQSKNLIETPLNAVHKYHPNGRSTAYYCYSYRAGKKMKHIHIKGGQVGNRRAEHHADEVIRAIALKFTIDEIKGLLRTQT